MRILNAGRLAQELARGEVTPREKGYYLFAGFVMWMLVNASGFATASPLWSWASLIETVALVLVTILGFSHAYDAAGGDENPDFVAQFTCLYLPVSVTTIIVVWAGYWSVIAGFRESLMAISESRLQFAINLSRIGTSLAGALVMLAVLIVQAVTFYRITRLFRIVRSRSARSAPLDEVVASE